MARSNLLFGTKMCSNSAGHMTNMVAMSIVSKNI